MQNSNPRRGGPNGVYCLGNNEPDKNWIANWQGESIGAYTKEEAYKILDKLRNRQFTQ